MLSLVSARQSPIVSPSKLRSTNFLLSRLCRRSTRSWVLGGLVYLAVATVAFALGHPDLLAYLFLGTGVISLGIGLIIRGPRNTPTPDNHPLTARQKRLLAAFLLAALISGLVLFGIYEGWTFLVIALIAGGIVSPAAGWVLNRLGDRDLRTPFGPWF